MTAQQCKTELENFFEEVKRINDEGQVLHTVPLVDIDSWSRSHENTGAAFFIIKYKHIKYDKYQYKVCLTIEGHLTAQEIKKKLQEGEVELICYCHATMEQFSIVYKHVLNGYRFDEAYDLLLRFVREDRWSEVDKLADMYGYEPFKKLIPLRMTAQECKEWLESLSNDFNVTRMSHDQFENKYNDKMADYNTQLIEDGEDDKMVEPWCTYIAHVYDNHDPVFGPGGYMFFSTDSIDEFVEWIDECYNKYDNLVFTM